MKPLIGILASVAAQPDGGVAGDRFFVGEQYLAAVYAAGGVPLILPWAGELSSIGAQLQAVNGLLLIGGYDLAPELYGEEPAVRLGPVFPDRDEYEIAAIRMAVCQSKPVLGVCRGMQVINVAFGGSLYQDVAELGAATLQHQQNSRGNVALHNVKIFRETGLYQVIAKEVIRTNSFHHQAVKDVAPGFAVNAAAEDNIIEGIENREAAILGVQWHPEMMLRTSPVMLQIFRWLVDMAGDAAMA